MSVSQLKITFWNSRSIRNNFTELFDFLTKTNVDVCMLSETWLKHTDKLYHPNYVCVRKDREIGVGGGVAILVKKSMQFNIININTEIVENIGIKIISSDHKSFKLFSTYFPGGTNTSELRNSYKKDLRKLFNLNGSYIFCGDFNSKHRNWGCSRANTWGNILNEFTTFFPISVSYSNDPTYIPSSSRFSPSNIDLVLSNIPTYISQPLTINKFDSDHLPVKFVLNLNFKHIDNFIMDYDKTNWKIYRSSLKNSLCTWSTNLDLIDSAEDIDKNVIMFSEKIIAAVRSSVPLKTLKTNFLKLPQYILNLIKTRNYFRRQWSHYRQLSDYEAVKHYSVQIRKQIFQYRNASWNKKLSSIEKRSKPFWNICKIMRRKHSEIPPLRESNKTLILSHEKANLFAYNFLENHKVSNQLGSPLVSNLVDTAINQLNSQEVDTPLSEYVDSDYVQDLLHDAPLRKSAGHDDIKNIMLRHLPKEAVIYFTFLINSCIKLQYFPNAWKTAKIIPIRKPGKPANAADSYRPISLLSSLSKVFEKIIKNKISLFLDTHKIIPNEQFGFRQHHSTTHQIKRIYNHVKSNFDHKKSTGLMLLDVEKAFDSIWHDGLIYKLINLKFPLPLVKIINCFLKNRYFCVFLNDEYSDMIELPAGVPQGSVLGPLLYIIYCSDFPKLANCSYAMYADDIGIFYSHAFGNQIVTKLQDALQNMADYLCTWKIKLNIGKTQAIFFTRKRSHCFIPSTGLKLGSYDIPWANTVRYLGVIFDKKVSFCDHVKYIQEKVNLAIKMLYPLINRRSGLSDENKLIIYKSIFQPIILYACPAWSNIAKSHVKKLQICQNKVLKMMLRLPWHFSTRKLHDESKTKILSDQIQNLTERFKIRSSFSDNLLITELS